MAYAAHDMIADRGATVRGVASLGLVLLASLVGPARADPIAYASTGDDQFGVVDLTTGVFTDAGDMGLRLTGLGVGPGAVLYGGGYHSGTLYSVDPLDGSLTAIGSAASFTYFAMGSTSAGLFALDASADMNLYSIDPATGAVTLIGPTGVSPFASAIGMSTGSDTLYLTRNSSLYEVDTATGAASLIGASSLGFFAPMVVEDGTIFTGAAFPSAIWELNASDGAGTFLADETGDSGPFGNFWGLAPDPLPQPVPEPSSLALMLGGIAAISLACPFASRGARQDRRRSRG